MSFFAHVVVPPWDGTQRTPRGSYTAARLGETPAVSAARDPKYRTAMLLRNAVTRPLLSEKGAFAEPGGKRLGSQ
jgi:hypothetical protein